LDDRTEHSSESHAAEESDVCAGEDAHWTAAEKNERYGHRHGDAHRSEQGADDRGSAHLWDSRE